MKKLWSIEIRGQKFVAAKISAKIRRPYEFFFFKDNFVLFCSFFFFKDTEYLFFIFFKDKFLIFDFLIFLIFYGGCYNALQ